MLKHGIWRCRKEGPYTICIDDFMTGSVIKYWQIDPRSIDFPSIRSGEARSHAQAWDLALQKGDAKFRTMMHTLCWNNCHSHVGYVFKMMGRLSCFSNSGGTANMLIYAGCL